MDNNDFGEKIFRIKSLYDMRANALNKKIKRISITAAADFCVLFLSAVNKNKWNIDSLQIAVAASAVILVLCVLYLFILLDRFEGNKIIYRQGIKKLRLEARSGNDGIREICREEENALSEDSPQVKFFEKRLTVIIIVVVLVLTGIQVMIDQTLSFTPENWKEHKNLRKYMSEDLMRKTNPSTGSITYKYNLNKYSDAEIRDMFYEPENENIEMDFKVAISEKARSRVRYEAYYLYTDSDGKNIWLYIEHDTGYRSFSLMYSGMMLFYS